MSLSYSLSLIPHSYNFWNGISQQIIDSLLLENMIQKGEWPHLGRYNTLLPSNPKCKGKMFLRVYSMHWLLRTGKILFFPSSNLLSKFDNQVCCSLFHKQSVLSGKPLLLEGEERNKECHLSMPPIFPAFPALTIFWVFLKAIKFRLRDPCYLFFTNYFAGQASDTDLARFCLSCWNYFYNWLLHRSFIIFCCSLNFSHLQNYFDFHGPCFFQCRFGRC